jgi:hypothetical protein
MDLYTRASRAPYLWPAPMETVYELVGVGPAVPGSKVPHLTVSDQLFIAAVANLPRPARPWGAITWLSAVYGITRPTVYALGQRGRQGLAVSAGGRPGPEETAWAIPTTSPGETWVAVTPNRVARLALSLAFPGKVAVRPMQECLAVAFDQSRGVGTLSQLLTQAGQRAGHVLSHVDHRPLGPVIALRDETYFQDWPILLVIDPVSTTILLGVVSTDCQADTWGAALLVSQERGAVIKGLVEDMARMYPKSQALAGLKERAVEKDTWHVERWGYLVRHDLERMALAALRQVYALETQLRQTWDEAVFLTKYLPVVAKAERLLADHDTFARWLNHLCDALELVDLHSGEIRDRPTNAWLLEETLRALEAIDQPVVRKFVRSLRRYQAQLLTFLDWAAELLVPYQARLAASLPDSVHQRAFVRCAARVWRLRQALINGHRAWRTEAAEAEAHLERLLAGDATRQTLATDLMHLLDASGHTSSLIECLNGLLKSFLYNRQAFRNRDTAQAYLNLFVLWHNMRVYERGKRAGQSPYQWAGIHVGTDDWLELLGYPADA